MKGAPGESYSWHISPGVCGASDEVSLGTTASYPTLTIAANGTGSVTAVVGSAAPSTGNFFVIVHAANGAGVALACGNLKQIVP
ncbi:MAG: hypothetical protein M3081_02100 [Gemmatimonadota bacterium]|nr:hypothetical protein [Gemmatimonadota bacterium]